MDNYPTIKPFGDSAILLEWPALIDLKINEEVTFISGCIHEAEIPGVQEIIVAYQSITILYNPIKFTYHEIQQSIQSVILETNSRSTLQTMETLEIPVCYDKRFALDSEAIMQQTRLDWAEIIRIHSATEYRVYMTGFTPGFAYLGGLSNKLESSRKSDPRLSIPEGSVAIAGLQTGIYSMSSPGGWNIIGRTPIKLLDFESEDPFHIQSGQQIQFKPISVEEFESW